MQRPYLVKPIAEGSQRRRFHVNRSHEPRPMELTERLGVRLASRSLVERYIPCKDYVRCPSATRCARRHRYNCGDPLL